MYSYIIGEVKHINKEMIVLENNGIGYKILMPLMDTQELTINETCKVFTEYIVREDGVSLYGFVTQDELDLFLSLTSVSSVGPKAGLSILSTLYVLEIKKAILSNDINALTKAPGIGRKTASRIILELSDKIDINDLDELIEEKTISKNISENYDFALEALINLGYQKSVAEKALSSLDVEGMELSQVVRQALKKM